MKQRIEAPKHERRAPAVDQVGAALVSHVAFHNGPRAAPPNHPTARLLRQSAIRQVQRSSGNVAVQRFVQSTTSASNFVARAADTGDETVMRSEAQETAPSQRRKTSLEAAGERAASRLYTPEQIALIGELPTLGTAGLSADQRATLAAVHLPQQIDGDRFARTESAPPEFRAAATNKKGDQVIEIVCFQTNGLLLYEVQTIPTPTSAKKSKSGGARSRQQFYDAHGTQLHMKAAAATEARERQEKRFRAIAEREEQQRISQDFKASSQEVAEGGITIAQVWEMTNPGAQESFLQSSSTEKGVAKMLLPELKKMVDSVDAGDFNYAGEDAEQVTALEADLQELEAELQQLKQSQASATDKESSRRIKQNIAAKTRELQARKKQLSSHGAYGEFKKVVDGITQMIEAEKKKGAGEDVSGRVAATLASNTAGKLCNVISYYLIGRALGKIDLSFPDYYRREVSVGRIGLGGSGSKRGVYMGAGSTAWEKNLGLKRDRSKETSAPVNDTAKRPGELDRFLVSNVHTAISWQDTDNDGKPNHWFLIVKDPEGRWRNADHTSSQLARRGNETDFGNVYGLAYDAAAQQAAQKQLKEAQK